MTELAYLEEVGWTQLNYVNLLVPHVLSGRERDALLAGWDLEGAGVSEDQFYRLLSGRLRVAPSTAKRYLTAGRKKLKAYQQGVDPGDVIDLRKPVHAICRELGLEPRLVRRIVLTPKRVMVEEYLLDENGQKYVEYEGGGPATKTRDYAVIA